MTTRRAYDLALLAALAVSALLFLLPQFFFVRQSLYENLGPGQIGTELTFANYMALLTDSFYLEAFARTIMLSAVATVTGLLLAAPAAYYLARLQTIWVRWLVVLLLISSFVSIVVKVLGLTMLLGSNGPIPVALRALTGGWWSMSLLNNGTAVVIGLVQYTLPLLIMLLFGVLQNIPISLEEAALVHGASDRRLVRRVLLPLALPGIITAGLDLVQYEHGRVHVRGAARRW